MPHPFAFRSASSIGLVGLLVFACILAVADITTAQSSSDSGKDDSSSKSSSGFQFADLVGKKIDVQTKRNYYRNAEVEEVEPGKVENSVKHFKLTDGKRSVRVVASKIVEIHLDGRNLDVAYDKRNRSLVQDLDKRAERLKFEKETNARLNPQGFRLWKHLTVKQEEKFLYNQARFIKDAKAKLPGVDFRQVETKYFSFVTDLGPAEADGYIAYLDEMYAELCKAFGLPPEKNIWAGKCVVFAFRAKETYVDFEAKVMSANPAVVANTQGLCHQNSDGNVIFAGYKGKNDFFGHVLVHETSHGFVHRYLSSARAPSWLNEGMADWLADKVVGGTKIKVRQRKSAAQVKQTKDWGDVLNIPRITVISNTGSARCWWKSWSRGTKVKGDSRNSLIR